MEMEESLDNLALRLVRRGYSIEHIVTHLVQLVSRPSDGEIKAAVVEAFSLVVQENISFVRQRNKRSRLSWPRRLIRWALG
jgi:hypothetical protein